MPNNKVVLAYSGGLDTSIIIPWLIENYGCEVIAVVSDVGQGEDMNAVAEKAKKTGASKVVVEDLREEFLREYVFPCVKAGAVYENKYLLGTSMARPVIAIVSITVSGGFRLNKVNAMTSPMQGSNWKGRKPSCEWPGTCRTWVTASKAIPASSRAADRCAG